MGTRQTKIYLVSSLSNGIRFFHQSFDTEKSAQEFADARQLEEDKRLEDATDGVKEHRHAYSVDEVNHSNG